MDIQAFLTSCFNAVALGSFLFLLISLFLFLISSWFQFSSSRTNPPKVDRLSILEPTEGEHSTWNSLASTSFNQIMDIQAFLTYFLNLLVMITIIFTLVDLCFYLANSWQQLNPPTRSTDFYRAVKDLLGNDESQLIPSTT